MTQHQIGSHRPMDRCEQGALLQAEKAWTPRARPAWPEHLRRRALPWVRVEKDYVFQGPDGPLSLSDLFDGRDQLIVYHFMFGPDWNEGCPGCSFLADHVDGARQHFEHQGHQFCRGVARSCSIKLMAYRKRMGWSFPWVSSLGNDFNFDYHVSFDGEHEGSDPTYNFEPRTGGEAGEAPGVSVFFKDQDLDDLHAPPIPAMAGAGRR